MKYRKVLFFFILFVSFWMFVQAKSFASEKEHILIVNSYNKTDRWSYDLINEITKTAIAKGFDGITYVEHLDANLYTTTAEIDSCKNQLFSHYQSSKIKAVVVLGNVAWGLLYQEIKEQWKGVPLILCAEFNFIGPRSCYLEKKAIPDSLKIPLESTIKSCDVILLYAPYYVKHTLIVMKQLMPKMDTVHFISDFRYTSAEQRKELKEVITKEYPDLALNCITEAKVNTADLIETLRMTPKNHGIFYSSWLKKAEVNGVHYVFSTLTMPISSCTSNPVFVLSDMLHENAVAGGYMIPAHEIKASLSKAIRDALNDNIHGVSVRQSGTARPILNYQVLQKNQIPTALYPQDSIFLNKPSGFFQKYYKELFLLLFFILFIVLFPYIRMLVSSKHNEKRLLSKYKNLFANIPIPYMQVKLILKNEDANPTKDNIIDFEIVEVNPEFKKYLPSSRFNRGQRISGVKEKYSYLNNLCLQAFSEIKVIAYYHDVVLDKHFDVIAFFDQEAFLLNIFWLDHTSLWNVKEALHSTNHMLGMALDMANIIPWEWNLKTGYIINKKDFNTASTRIQNYLFDEISLPELLERIHPNDRPRVYQSLRNLENGKIEWIKEELRLVFKDENESDYYEWFEMKAIVKVRNRIGEPSIVLGSSMLITERKNMEFNLITAKERAEESNRLKSAFLANMSHEIRTPLNAIIGFSKILMETNNLEERHEYMAVIEHNNYIMLKLIEDIIDLSKIESGILDLNYMALDINSLLKSAECTFARKAQDKAIELVLEMPQGPNYFRVEKNRLTQILSCLISNALKFTDEGSVTLGYREDNNGIFFYVKDTGCGIPYDKQDKVFDRFFKIDNFKQGAGLGLSICKALIEAMNGTIGCTDNGDKGSIFWFTLPFEKAQEQEVEC